MTKFRSTTLAALVVIAALAGCGGSNDGGTGSTTAGDTGTASTTAGDTSATPATVESSTKAAFIVRADKICNAADEQQVENYKSFKAEHGKKTGSKEEEEELVRVVGLPAIETELEELRALGAPKGDEGEISAILDGLEAAIEESEKKPLSTFTPQNPFAAPEEKAAKYGLKECGFT